MVWRQHCEAWGNNWINEKLKMEMYLLGCDDGFMSIRLCALTTLTSYALVDTCEAGWPDLDSKWVKLAPNGTNPGLIQIRFQYILALYKVWKSPVFIPFGSNLPHFWPKSDNTVTLLVLHWWQHKAWKGGVPIEEALDLYLLLITEQK